ncbi:hypothetical protein DL769_007980 [Monosporascus sp. CRB-8-3]|nr:hypothetical protein DL769_007980 [Monosporascus sp. CRB-8-3]
MKVSAVLTTMAFFAAQAHAACTRVPDAEGNSLSQIEHCTVERNSENIPTGRMLCTQANAWLRNGFNWGSRVSSPDNDVIFKIIPSTETGPLEDEPIYYFCSAGTNDEFVWTRDGTHGAFTAFILA